MRSQDIVPRSTLLDAVFGVLDPIPYGFFVAGMIFDIVYAQSAVTLWGKGAAWLVSLGLVFAVIPRVINLVRVWITLRRVVGRRERIGFWLNLAAIVVAIFNALVHTQDAYAIVPLNVWLSVITVLLLSISYVAAAVQRTIEEPAHV